MLTHTGSYERTVREDVSLQTYRDDDGPHLTLLLPSEGRSIDVRLSDSTCKSLANALGALAEDPF